LFNPSIKSTGTFNETTKTLRTGLYGFGGWSYNNGVDLSAYKYLVVKLASATTSGASFRIFDENSYSSRSAMYSFGSTTQINVNLATMTKSGTKVDPSHLYIIGVYSNGGTDIVFSDVYVTNNTDYSKPTALEYVSNTQMDENEIVDVYSLMGVKLRSQIERKKAIDGLSDGIYLVGNNKKFIKTLKTNAIN